MENSKKLLQIKQTCEGSACCTGSGSNVSTYIRKVAPLLPVPLKR